jgi:lysylphosphatidylglycerol synthetase-like protein (DUF2156 family)
MSHLQTINSQRSLLVESVRRWGDMNTDAILDPVCQIYKSPLIEGLIGYRSELGHAIVFGEPVCANDKKLQLAEAFHQYCKELNLNVIYVMVFEEFKEQMLRELCPISLEFGKKLVLDPQDNWEDKTGSKSRLVRKKMRQATKDHVIVKEYLGSDLKVEEGILQVGKEWLKKRRGPQIHISFIRLFDDRLGKRWFYAESKGEIVGFLILNQLEVHSSWLLNNLMITPRALHGTSELLIMSALQEVKKENNTLVWIGPIPSEALGEIKGLGRLSSWFIRKTFKIAKRVFRLDAQRVFWDKFEPKYEPSYLLCNQKTISLKAMMAIMRAMNTTSY